MSTSDPERHVEISALKHTMTAINLDYSRDDPHVYTIRYIGVVKFFEGGKEAGSENCRHLRSGIGHIEIHPHETPAEAVSCARIVAAARRPGVEVREVIGTGA